jgi:hypothetical protein
LNAACSLDHDQSGRNRHAATGRDHELWRGHKVGGAAKTVNYAPQAENQYKRGCEVDRDIKVRESHRRLSSRQCDLRKDWR